MADYVICPRCKKRVLNQASIRQGSFGGANIVDVGYGCPKCKHEWGFEVFKNKKKLKKVV